MCEMNGYRVFSDGTFIKHGEFDTKDGAKKQADIMRRLGYKARVVKTQSKNPLHVVFVKKIHG